ncbi:MAG: PIN domain-containing protein [Planctomycetota bacterium]|nr:PIN domain-containing protein [Planctomycetota bacterium]
MIRWLLDTSACRALIKRKPRRLRRWLTKQRPFSLGISALSVAELEDLAKRSALPLANLAALREFLIPLVIVPFDAAAAHAYSRLAAKALSAPALPVLLAAQAARWEAGIITDDPRPYRHLRRVPLLDIADWR